MAEYLTGTCGERPTMTTTCDGHHRPSAETTAVCDVRDFDEFEFRGGQLIVGCKCVRHDGMQHECRRNECMGRPQCLTYPAATCAPSDPCRRPRDTVVVADAKKKSWPPPPKRRERKAAAAAARSVSVPVPVSADDRARRRAAAREMLRWAVGQYDDRPALKTAFAPCRVHACRNADNNNTAIDSDDNDPRARCTGQGGRW